MTGRICPVQVLREVNVSGVSKLEDSSLTAKAFLRKKVQRRDLGTLVREVFRCDIHRNKTAPR